MIFLRRFLALILATISIISLCGCKNQGGIIDLTYFNTAVHIETHDKPISENTLLLVKQALSAFESDFSTNATNSLINRFNDAETGSTFNLTERESEVISQSKRSYLFTDGLFNPAVYPLVKLWGFSPYSYTANYTPPTDAQIQNALNLCNFDQALFDSENKILTKAGDVKLDLSGLVKGLCADVVAKILKDAGHSSGYVNIGGSSLNLLKVSSLGIRHPEKAGDSIISINTEKYSDLSISTSGDYERYYTDKDGNKYCHLINPFTGKTANTCVRSATVIGVDGALGDAITTALCLCEYSLAKIDNQLLNLSHKILSAYPNAMIFIVYSNEQTKLLLTNKKQGEDFTLNDTQYSVINI